MNTRFSIILLTYNSAPFLTAVIQSLTAQTGQNWEAIVIDQASRDNTVGLMRQLAGSDRRFKIISNAHNTGFCAGINQGIVMSRGEVILFLNHDAVLERSYLELALATIARDPQVAAVQGKIFRRDFSRDEAIRDTNILDTTGLVMLKSRRAIRRGEGEVDHGQYNAAGEVFGVDGAVSFWRREALEDIKLCVDDRCEYLDVDFFMYKDDVDLSWRARLAGWKIVYDPLAYGWHQRGAGVNAARDTRAIMAERRTLNPLAQYHSWKNSHLLQLKNDLAINLLRDLPWWLAKEVASWLYIMVAEPRTLRATADIVRLLPRVWLKRRAIMAKRRIAARDIERWFE
ncbi:glycosyltransferase family 2 protein [Candidatus Parcubacteria bacterium]|nr:glycosyltransferase family 2 protein [Candidatus Parcubacteria bacterium]